MSPIRIGVDGIDLTTTLRTLTFLRGDPTVRLTTGRFERASVTPAGTGAVIATWDAAGTEATVQTLGEGGPWLRDRAAALIGAEDDASGFTPPAGPLRDAWRRHPGDRIVRTGTLWHDAAWFIVQQRVTTADAADQWRRLVGELGTPVEGTDGLLAPPAPDVIARTSYPELHRIGIERRRAEHLRTAARSLAGRHELADEPWSDVRPRLASIPGIGPWTLGCLATQTWGEPDEVIPGDDGLPSIITWLLARERRGDDRRMLELLEPYRPHRYRVVRLAFATGIRPPRRAPRGRRTDIRRR